MEKLDSSKDDINTILENGIDLITRSYCVGEGTLNEKISLPSCTFAIERVKGQLLEYYVLGDFSIIVKDENSDFVIVITR